MTASECISISASKCSALFLGPPTKINITKFLDLRFSQSKNQIINKVPVVITFSLMSLILINLKLEFLSRLTFGLDSFHPKRNLFFISQADKKTQLWWPTSVILSRSLIFGWHVVRRRAGNWGYYARNNLTQPINPSGHSQWFPLNLLLYWLCQFK